MSEGPSSYTYKRFMRDGSTKEITAVVRSRASTKPKENKRGKSKSEQQAEA